MPLTPALRRQRQMDLCELETRLVYKASSKIARVVTQKNYVSKKTKQKNPEIITKNYKHVLWTNKILDIQNPQSENYKS